MTGTSNGSSRNPRAIDLAQVDIDVETSMTLQEMEEERWLLETEDWYDDDRDDPRDDPNMWPSREPESDLSYYYDWLLTP